MGWLIGICIFTVVLGTWAMVRINYKPDNEILTPKDCMDIKEQLEVKTILENGKVAGFVIDNRRM